LKTKDANAAGKKSLKKGKNKIWTIEECSSESEISDQETSTLQSNNKTISLELNDIDKSFKIKKSLEKQKDGSFIEVIRPEFFEDDDDDADDDPEIEDQEESHANENLKAETSKNGTSNNSNPLMEKLKSSRFRYLNELLYTHPSAYSFEFFEK
jgi:DNA polymerase III alpha subunit (gram-positive type)